MESFIIENAGNTCYIDSLLMGLFYTKSSLEVMLDKDIKNTMGIYLQEFIKEKFIKMVRDNKSILSEDMTMIKTLCFQLGWRVTNSNTHYNEEFYRQQDVNEFFTFLMEIFENELIEITRHTITEINDETGAKEYIPFIPLAIPESHNPVTIKQMLHAWLFDNISDFKKFVPQNQREEYVSGLNTYTITNIPNMLALSINRFKEQDTRIDTDVIIQKKIILPAKDNYFNSYEWFFHAAICHKGISTRSGHYYTLLSNNNKWYLFDDMKVPCLKEVSMTDKSVTNLIKKECIFLIYKLT